LEALLRLRQAACHRGLIPGQDAATSSKVELLVETLDEVIAEGHKALVFSQWTSLLDRIEPALTKAGLAFCRLDGSTRDRAAVVDTFQDPAGPPVMLISLKAGGTGLTLTAADNVFLVDPWWNPAVEDQAADRAHRIGQDRPVLIQRLVAEETVEEKILALQERKRALADAALGDADQAIALTRDDLLALDGDTTALTVLPLFHSFGQTVMHNAVLFGGGHIVLLPRFDATAAFQLMQAHKVSLFAGVPTMYFALLHHPDADTYDLSSLERCVSGGAAMPVEVMGAFDRKYGVNILEGYGLSETSPVASFNVLDRPKRPGSIGLPIWGVEFQLVDAEGKVVDAEGTPGEICIRGHNVMKGYFNRPEATAEAIVDGWFHTGDIATRDAEGYYFIVDRKKDMVIRGGFNVYPREIEEVLYGHPAIGEAAVIGVPHEKLGEEVKAIVALRPGQSVTPEALIAYCKEHLAAYKYPRIVEIIEALPKGPTGKILKRELRAQPAS
ncbi:MAG: AMP-binding protein, partial [Myxococcales bacterium]|nr:AMP-binding protein [Myxococcales bacterium]